MKTINNLGSIMLVLSLFFMVLVGCGENDGANDAGPLKPPEEEINSVEEEEEEEEEERDYISQGRTPYMVLEEDSFQALDEYTREIEKLEDIDEEDPKLIFLEKEHPEVQKMLLRVEEYLQTSNIDYTDFEYEGKTFYSENLINRYKEEGHFEWYYGVVEENEFVREYLGFDLLYMVFDCSFSRVKVRGISKTQFLSAVENSVFLKDNNLELNKVYLQNTFLWWQLYEGGWLLEGTSFHRWVER